MDLADRGRSPRNPEKRARRQRIAALVEEHLETGPPALEPGMSPAQWREMHPDIRRLCLRRHFELKQGEEKWRAEAQEWAKLEPYAKLAEARGLTLEQLIEHFTGIEARIRRDPADGIPFALRQAGHDPVKVIRDALLSLAPEGCPEHVIQRINDDPVGMLRHVIHASGYQPAVLQ